LEHAGARVARTLREPTRAVGVRGNGDGGVCGVHGSFWERFRRAGAAQVAPGMVCGRGACFALAQPRRALCWASSHRLAPPRPETRRTGLDHAAAVQTRSWRISGKAATRRAASAGPGGPGGGRLEKGADWRVRSLRDWQEAQRIGLDRAMGDRAKACGGTIGAASGRLVRESRRHRARSLMVAARSSRSSRGSTR